ncbi:MAG: hypothetical protein ACRCX2_10190 [Paraclostridium sp.]
MKGVFEKIELKEQEINMYIRILKIEEDAFERAKLLNKIEHLEDDLYILEQGLNIIGG